MKKMLKRADGSKSRRGLWDNIRAKAAANKKAGKKGKAPSKDMLEQEAKIKAEMKMGGDWMQGSKELKFGGPTKYQTAGRFSVSGPIGTSGGKQACIGESCKGVVEGGTSYAGGSNSGTNYTGKGAQGLSMKPKIDRSRIVNQTADEKLAGLENRAKYAAEGEARMAQKKAERDARAAASAPAEVKYDFKQVYATDPADPNAKKKTGGKRKFNKK
jgi:hypothetical protein